MRKDNRSYNRAIDDLYQLSKKYEFIDPSQNTKSNWTNTKEKLLTTIDHLKSNDRLSNYRFELNRYESAIKVIDLWIEDAHQDFDKDYAIVAKDNDLYNLSFETTFDYRDTFDERLASELISNGLKFEIYKNKLTVSRADLALQDLPETIDYVANELRYFG